MPEQLPLFVIKWNKDILAVILVSFLADIVLSNVTQNFVPLNVTDFSWYAAYSVLFAIVVPLVLNGRGTLKVREIKFHDNSLVVSGLKFKMEYDYEDISRLELERHTGFLSRNKIVFAIKYFEPRVFRYTNPLSRELHTDLYTWMSIKVPPSALQKGYKSVS
ncbi:MAG TPA: hypothetical protein VGR53_02320 [Nitrososphaerales archaeon]|nr:hypothetical protein [Nitrososphaerales archaeon]